MANINRRQFLSRSTAVGFGASLTALSGATASRAWAADTSGYKAVICIFLKGGMDSSDTILPYDQASYDQLVQTRSGLFAAHNYTNPESSRNRDNLLALSPANASDFGGRQFALPQQMSAMKSMFDDGELAILGNVGPLLEPVTRADMENKTANLPAHLYSHNDQQSTWMALDTEGTRFGWGGRFIDAAIASAPGDDPRFSAITVGSNDVFLSGETVQPFKASSGGAPLPDILARRNFLGSQDANDATRAAIRAFWDKRNHGYNNVYARDLNTLTAKGISTSYRIDEALQTAAPITTVFPDSQLGRQMQAIVETMNIQSTLNVSRQMFYATKGGFDTHNSQANNLPVLHGDISASLAALRSALIEIGRWNDTLIFTASDFGRTLVDNGDGTDHGWGGHQFVLGGRVNGNRIFGDIPGYDPESPDYTPSRGRLLPSTSVEQFASGIGSWFGLSNAELADVLPNLSRFDSAPSLIRSTS